MKLKSFFSATAKCMLSLTYIGACIVYNIFMAKSFQQVKMYGGGIAKFFWGWCFINERILHQILINRVLNKGISYLGKIF